MNSWGRATFLAASKKPCANMWQLITESMKSWWTFVLHSRESQSNSIHYLQRIIFSPSLYRAVAAHPRHVNELVVRRDNCDLNFHLSPRYLSRADRVPGEQMLGDGWESNGVDRKGQALAELMRDHKGWDVQSHQLSKCCCWTTGKNRLLMGTTALPWFAGCTINPLFSYFPLACEGHSCLTLQELH